MTYSSGRLPVRFVLAALLLAAGFACRRSSDVMVIKLAHGLDVTHPVHKGIVHMAEMVDSLSGGSMRIDIYPGGQLGGERELVELLQIGSLGMTKVSTAHLEPFVPEIRVLALPYLFRDDAHRWQVLNGPVGRQLLRAGEKFRLRGLCFYDAGTRSFYTRERPVYGPDDLKGLKIRVMNSPTSLKTVHALGGSPTPIPFGELYSALQQGIVDAAENNPPSFYTAGHYTVCKYYTLDEHTATPDILLISMPVWNRLTPQQRHWLQTAADSSVVYQRALWKQASDEALRKVQEAGVTISHPDKRPFKAAIAAFMESFAGTELAPLIAAIDSTGNPNEEAR